jgi:DNA polymerase-1
MTILIVDGNNMAHRARHTFSLSNKGVDVSTTYGTLRMLQSIISKNKPTSVIVCFDGGIPEFRRRAIPEYKANRHKDEDPAMWEDFNRQMNELSDYALPLMGMVVAKKPCAEADDLMYHASRMCTEKSIIVTSDKDLFQAVNENVSVLNPARDTLYTVDNFQEKVGIALKDYIDWRALQGDGSDNIPGVVGIGEKTATKLFDTFGSLTRIVNAALGHHPTQRLEGKIAENIMMFGWERLSKNVLATALYADRVGARQAIIDATEEHTVANKDRVKRYLMKNGFVSLMDGSFYGCILRLQKPELNTDNMRIPVVAGRRVAMA